MAIAANVQIANIWEKATFDGPGTYVELAEEPDGFHLALNCLSPGKQNSMHYHIGRGHSFLVVKGSITFRYRHKDARDDETTEVDLHEGDCVLIPEDVYYQQHNRGPDQAILYHQVHRPDVEQFVILGEGTFTTEEYRERERSKRQKQR